jgi:hypothetical protein
MGWPIVPWSLFWHSVAEASRPSVKGHGHAADQSKDEQAVEQFDPGAAYCVEVAQRANRVQDIRSRSSALSRRQPGELKPLHSKKQQNLPGGRFRSF